MLPVMLNARYASHPGRGLAEADDAGAEHRGERDHRNGHEDEIADRLEAVLALRERNGEHPLVRQRALHEEAERERDQRHAAEEREHTCGEADRPEARELVGHG